MTNPFIEEHLEDNPNLRQARASDPERSVWVGASAGTGKTKVLTDRVLRLMLPRLGLPRESATPSSKILCLTFTKTAAAEMSNRIHERLSAWSVKPDVELKKELTALIGAEPSQEIMEEARRLFARVLDTPGGLKIMTLHSFCQSVLKRFPVEAGLPPHFQLIDEKSAIEYLQKCLHNIIREVQEDPKSDLARAFNHLTLFLNPDEMSDLMQQIMSKRSLLTEIFKYQGDFEGSAENTIKQVYVALKLDPKMTEKDLFSRIGNLTDQEEIGLKEALEALLKGSKTDQKKAAFIQPWLEQKEDRVRLFDFYAQAFFTQKGEIQKTHATKGTVETFPDILNVMQKEAERLKFLQDMRKTLRFADLNSSLLRIASEMVGRYESYKKYRSMLDYEDLIIKTSSLLSEDQMVHWVSFKLDEGIDHILVDEAQDTSRNQWRVVSSLCGEFFEKFGSRENVQRTLFVVGDEKQSIFSFQGADPYEFARMQSFFGEHVQSMQEGWEVFLEHSFRSTRTVLEIVDKVFRKAEVKQGVVFDTARDVRHLVFREGHAGSVELWPLIKTSKKEKSEPWTLPTEIDMGDNAASRLAHKMAMTIKGWIDTKEILVSKGRPIRAGDVLILVRSRGAFVDLLMRALKTAHVPVAGVDRMALFDEIAVMDLVVLAQFALLPKDDLTLATLLKSPLIGLSEEELYEVCAGRQKSLWVSLRDKNPKLAHWLQEWVAKAASVTPYEFFAEALTMPCFADDISGRRAFYARLGFDIQDALDEFLNICLHYEQSHTPSLQKFIHWFLSGETEIKREQEQSGSDLVRIMTVHGSKGLQAPIVFLPDTVKKPHDHARGRARLLWPEDEQGVPLWSPRQEFDAPFYLNKQGIAQNRQDEEYRRLLYVALTRAEDRLYVCGYRGKNNPKPDCWYHLVEEALLPSSKKINFSLEGEVLEDEEGNILHAHLLSHPQEVDVKKQNILKEKETVQAPVPNWAWTQPAVEPSPPLPLAPSRPDDEEPAIRGPLFEGDGWKYSRGILVHKILELLPQLPESLWDETLVKYLARPQLNISKKDQGLFAQEVLNVLHHPEFAPIFGRNSRAEVPIVGLTGKNILNRQIDRLLITDTEILIVDYKTNRPPPLIEQDVPVVYLKQMASYFSIIHKIYPQHRIKCALLWTDAPLLMPLSEKILDSYLS